MQTQFMFVRINLLLYVSNNVPYHFIYSMVWCIKLHVVCLCVLHTHTRFFCYSLLFYSFLFIYDERRFNWKLKEKERLMSRRILNKWRITTTTTAWIVDDVIGHTETRRKAKRKRVKLREYIIIHRVEWGIELYFTVYSLNASKSETRPFIWHAQHNLGSICTKYNEKKKTKWKN